MQKGKRRQVRGVGKVRMGVTDCPEGAPAKPKVMAKEVIRMDGSMEVK